MGIVLILYKCKFTKHCFLYWFLFIDLFIILFIICSISDSKTYSHNADCLKSKAVPRAFLTWRIQYSVFSFFSTSRHPAVGLKREQKRDHISARHRGEVLISWKRWEVLHSGAFQVLISPRHFLNPIWSSGNCTLSLPSFAFWNRFYPQSKSCLKSDCYFMLVGLPPCILWSMGCEIGAKVSIEEQASFCLLSVQCYLT